jgi:hypothetical protein
MSDLPRNISPSLDWHTLLGPLPSGAIPTRQPVASPEVLAGPSGWTVAGWEQLVLHLSAGSVGSRTSLVVLDANGGLLSASDAVLYRAGPNGSPPPDNSDAPALIEQESIGGRFEPDGSFHGTRWRSVAEDPGGTDELEWQSTQSEPSEDDVDRLRRVAQELIARNPSSAQPR